MAIWNQSLSESGTRLSQYRAQYIDAFSPILSALWRSLMPGTEIEMRHGQGWPAQETLAETLVRRHADDLRLGHTAWGPHRADLQFFVNGKPAFDALSQGQQKLLLYALRLGQGQLLYQQSQKRCIYLIDDLPAELDKHKRQLIGETLDQLKAQVFMTGIEKQDLAAFVQKPQQQLFHVEQGQIQAVN
jgi:DNA replication and repair protein RecF